MRYHFEIPSLISRRSKLSEKDKAAQKGRPKMELRRQAVLANILESWEIEEP